MKQRNKRPTNLLWMDLEFTTLDPDRGRIIEVAAIVTDFEFNELEQYHSIVKQDKSVIESADPAAKKMHSGGLFDQLDQGRDEKEVEKQLIELVNRHFKAPAVLAGNSIHQDRRFIRRWWPDLEAKLHYRMLDVSSFKVLMSGKHNKVFSKEPTHRALEDIRGSIMELRYYLELLER